MSLDKNHDGLASLSQLPLEKRPNWQEKRLQFPYVRYNRIELAEQCRKLGRSSDNEDYEGFMLEVAERLENGSDYLKDFAPSSLC